MSTAYLSRLPREFMRVVAGFSRTSGNYHLKRATIQPPAALSSRIWPWVDTWLERYRVSITTQSSFANNGLDDCDIAGKQFLELLKWLRVVFLQDAAVLQHLFPLFPLWQHPLFCRPEWRLFADDVLRAHNIAEEPMDMRIRKVLPHLKETMRSTREVILARVDFRSEGFRKELREGLDAVHDNLNALRASLPEETITIPRRLVPRSVLKAYLAGESVTPHSPVPRAAPAVLSPAPERAANPPLSERPRTSLIPLTAGGWPVQPYDVNISKVSDAWREWHVGLGEGEAKRDSIVALEPKFGSSWRYEQRMRQWHSRRKKLIALIEQRVAQGHKLEDVIQLLEATGKSLDRLRKDIERGVDLFKV